jgi:branched-chain amino acid transport system permease protein
MSAVSRSTIARAIVLATLVAVPLVQSNNYWVHVFTVALIGTILALGLQLLVGMAGLLSLGQAAFYGIGAYTAAILATSYGVPFPISLVCAGIAAAVSSLLLIPIVRLKGSSLAVATLGFGIIVHLVMLNEDGITGGSIGLMGIPKPFLFGFNVGSERAFYYVSLAIAALTFVALDRLRRSRFGRALIAISQDEEPRAPAASRSVSTKASASWSRPSRRALRARFTPIIRVT